MRSIDEKNIRRMGESVGLGMAPIVRIARVATSLCGADTLASPICLHQ